MYCVQKELELMGQGEVPSCLDNQELFQIMFIQIIYFERWKKGNLLQGRHMVLIVEVYLIYEDLQRPQTLLSFELSNVTKEKEQWEYITVMRRNGKVDQFNFVISVQNCILRYLNTLHTETLSINADTMVGFANRDLDFLLFFLPLLAFYRNLYLNVNLYKSLESYTIY